MAKWPLSFLFYRILTSALGPFLPLILNSRVKKGKEDANSKDQRFGAIEFEKSKNKLIWVHCASVGETMVGIMVAQKLLENNSDLEFLFTAQTTTAKAIFEKANLINSHFQFAPIDTPKIAHQFVTNLKPDLAIFVEGEIWPNLLHQIDKQGIKRAFINARMTQKSLQNWQKFHKLSQIIFGGFGFTHFANSNTFEAIKSLKEANNPNQLKLDIIGVEKFIGNLKLSAPTPKIDKKLISSIKNQTKGRKIWLCASSHNGEEEIILKAHKMLLQSDDKTLLIIAPRHLERKSEIVKICEELGLNAILKTQNLKISKNVQVLIWDTLGELGSAYKIADCAFIAGSLLPHIGGHNPIEPAQLECPIVTGPFFHNFADIYSDLLAINGALRTQDATSSAIEIEIENLLFTPQTCENLVANSKAFINNSQGMLEKVTNQLQGLL